MRHALTTRYVVVATVILVLAAGIFAVLANVAEIVDDSDEDEQEQALSHRQLAALLAHDAGR